MVGLDECPIRNHISICISPLLGVCIYACTCSILSYSCLHDSEQFFFDHCQQCLYFDILSACYSISTKTYRSNQRRWHGHSVQVFMFGNILTEKHPTTAFITLSSKEDYVFIWRIMNNERAPLTHKDNRCSCYTGKKVVNTKQTDNV